MTHVIDAVTDDDFDSEVLSSTTPVLVDFWAAWCGPCLQVVPVLEALARQNEGRLRVVRLDVDANPVTAAAYRVSGLPTLNLYDGGVVVRQVRGARPLSVLVRELGGYVTQPA